MNLPNAISLLRILLVAPFLVAVVYRYYPLALGIFLVAGFSDFLDGFLARRLGQKSLLGAFLDPLGDRLLTTVAYVALASQSLLPPWLAVTVVAKDLYVGIGAAILYVAGYRFVATASLWGKLATLLQFLTTGLILMAVVGLFPWPLFPLFYLTGLITIVACLDYIRQGVRLFSLQPARGGEE